MGRGILGGLYSNLVVDSNLKLIKFDSKFDSEIYTYVSSLSSSPLLQPIIHLPAELTPLWLLLLGCNLSFVYV